MSSFILIFIYICIGYILKNTKLPLQNLHLYLNKFLINIAVPALILLEIPKLELSSNNLIPMYISWLTMAGSAILIYYISKVFRFSKEVTGCLMLVGVLSNTIFLGIPIVTAHFGKESLPYIILYDQLGTVLWLSIYASIVIAFYTSKEKVSYKSIIKRVLTFPPLIAFITAILFKQYTYPSLLTASLEFLTLTLVPVSLIAVGLQLKFRIHTDEIKPFSVAILIKLILTPLFAIIICYIFGWSDLLSAKVSIMESGMATMITAGILASINGLAPRLANSIVAYSILFSFFTTWVLALIIA